MKKAFNSLRLVSAVLVLLVGVSGNALAGAHKAPAAPAGQTIVDVAVGAGSFNTLVTALKAADLVSALQGEGPFTVFAPTDAAFETLWPGAVEDLLKPENKEKLQGILLYHVVPGKIMSGDLSGTVNAETLQGSNLTIVVTDVVTVGGNATVVSADVAASNGVIHVIDKVLLPPTE
jgi:uncharacterized surface protein with fasciclin (FAS1) repeats